MLLQAEEVRLTYPAPGGAGVQFALNKLEVAEGQHTALTGPSGCGKSTLLNLLSGLQRADAGSLRLLDQEITKMGRGRLDKFRGQNIGFIYQRFHLLDSFSALENVLIGMRFGRGVKRGDRRARAAELLKRVGLSGGARDRSSALPRNLSVGEQQRVGIARALANGPKLILADEPTGALDPATAEEVFKLLLKTCEEYGCTLLMVTHDLELAARLPHQFDCSGLMRTAAPAAQQETTA